MVNVKVSSFSLKAASKPPVSWNINIFMKYLLWNPEYFDNEMLHLFCLKWLFHKHLSSRPTKMLMQTIGFVGSSVCQAEYVVCRNKLLNYWCCDAEQSWKPSLTPASLEVLYLGPRIWCHDVLLIPFVFRYNTSFSPTPGPGTGVAFRPFWTILLKNEQGQKVP